MRSLLFLSIVVCTATAVSADRHLPSAPPLLPGAKVWDVTDPAHFENTDIEPATPNDNTTGGVDGDDAVAINHVLAKAVQRRQSNDPTGTRNAQQIIYFPAGRYHVASPIRVPSDNNSYRDMYFFGEGSGDDAADASIIRLKVPSATGETFSDAERPRGVIEMIPYNAGSNTAFSNFVTGLRIEVPEGQHGAVGLVYAVNNNGAVRDVTIVDLGEDGHTGFALRHQNAGPGLIENLTVVGFDTGIEIKNNPSQVTIVDATVRNQHAGGRGILNNNKVLALEGIVSEQDEPVPAVQQIATDNTSGSAPDPGQISLIHSSFSFTGEGESGPAIRNDAGALYLRAITTAGYGDDVILDHGTPRTFADGDIAGEYVSVHGKTDAEQDKVILTHGTTETASLNLPIEHAPHFDDWASLTDDNYVEVNENQLDDAGNFKPGVQGRIDNVDWVIVNGGLAVDDTRLLQATLDSGAKYVALLPHQRFVINDTIVINGENGGNVEFLYGQNAHFVPGAAWDADDGTAKADDPVFHIHTPDADHFIMQGLINDRFVRQGVTGGSSYGLWYTRFRMIQNDSTKPVVLRDLKLNHSYKAYDASPDAGTLFIDGVTAAGTGTIEGKHEIFTFRGQKVFARHFNLERNIGIWDQDKSAIPHILNDGSDVFVFGQKIGEANGVFWRTTGGGRTEVLGGFCNLLWDKGDPLDDARIFDLVDGEMSLVAAERLRSDRTPMQITPHLTLGIIRGTAGDTVIENDAAPARRDLEADNEFGPADEDQARIIGLLRATTDDD